VVGSLFVFNHLLRVMLKTIACAIDFAAALHPQTPHLMPNNCNPSTFRRQTATLAAFNRPANRPLKVPFVILIDFLGFSEVSKRYMHATH